METFSCLETLKSLKIQKGDILDVASDILSIMMFCRKNGLKFDINQIIADLKEVVGSEGTIMIRSFNWDFCKGETFDIRSTPSQVGSFGNLVMNNPDFKRTKHPLYSWMVWGKYQEELCNMDNVNAFGIGSVFDFQYKHNAKLFCLGNLKVRGYTQIHHGEAVVKVPYRFEKVFTSKYLDINGNETERSYSMYVRYLDIDSVTDVFQKVDGEWERDGYVNTYFLEDLRFQSTKIKETLDYVINDLRNNYGKRVTKINGEMGFEKYINYDFKMK